MVAAPVLKLWLLQAVGTAPACCKSHFDFVDISHKDRKDPSGKINNGADGGALLDLRNLHIARTRHAGEDVAPM